MKFEVNLKLNNFKFQILSCTVRWALETEHLNIPMAKKLIILKNNTHPAKCQSSKFTPLSPCLRISRSDWYFFTGSSVIFTRLNFWTRFSLLSKEIPFYLLSLWPWPPLLAVFSFQKSCILLPVNSAGFSEFLCTPKH